MQSRYKKLKLSHEELEERNKQLEAMVAATSSGGATPILPPPNGQGKPTVSSLSGDGDRNVQSILRQISDDLKNVPEM